MRQEEIPQIQRPRDALLCIALVVMGAVSGCGPSASAEIEAIRFGAAWVFAFTTPPDISMQALMSGTAAVADGCLYVGDAVVVWRQEHLDTVASVVTAVEAGEVQTLQLGGGGDSLDEGATIADFPGEVTTRCASREIWYASVGALTVTEE